MGTLEQNQYFVKVEQGQIVTQMQPIKENLLRISRLRGCMHCKVFSK